MLNINIGKKIEEVLREKKFSVSLFAQKINTNRNNVYDIFKRKSIDTELLYKISKILNYNFFELYVGHKDSEKILIERSSLVTVDEQAKKHSKEIEHLENKVATLQENLRDKQTIIDMLTKRESKKRK